MPVPIGCSIYRRLERELRPERPDDDLEPEDREREPDDDLTERPPPLLPLAAETPFLAADHTDFRRLPLDLEDPDDFEDRDTLPGDRDDDRDDRVSPDDLDEERDEPLDETRSDDPEFRGADRVELPEDEREVDRPDS